MNMKGVAQVFDDMGNPLVIPGDSHIPLFISFGSLWL